MAGAPQGYIGRNPSDGRTTINRQTFNVTSGVQTSFTFTSGYDLGYLDVYLNGVKQNETTDYTAADGSTFSFASSTPAVQGDTLEAIAYKSFNTTNVTGSTRDFLVGRNLDVSGNVTIGSSLTVASDLIVNGTYTYVNTEILDIEDKTVGIASTSSASNTTADGAGIVVYGGSDGDKSFLWNKTKSNWVLVGGGVSIGTGCTIGSSTANVLEFSVDGAVNAKLNNYGAFIVGDGVAGEAWGNAYKTVQAGTGAFGGNAPAANAASYWTANAYYDDVNSRWEYIAADEASRLEQGNGALAYYNAGSGSADGAITWTERLRITSAGRMGIGENSPDGMLHLKGSIPAIYLEDSDGTHGQAVIEQAGDSIKIRQDAGNSSSGTLSDIRLEIDATERLRVTTTGAVVTGILTATSFSGPMSGTTGTFTGDVSIADKIVHIGDTNTAIRFPANDTISAETAGSERLRITSTGEIVTQGLTGSTFDNDSANTKILEITGDGTAGEYGVLNISGNQNANNTTIGALKFVNRENSDGSSGGNAGSKNLALIAVYSVTSESNAGDDAGGYMQFATKPEAGGVAEAMRIDSSGRVLIGGTSVEGHADADNLTVSSSARTGITIRSATDNTGNIFFSDATSGGGEYAGYVQYSHTSDYLLFGTNANDRVQIDTSGRVNIGSLSQRTVWGGNTAVQIEGLNGATSSASIVRNSNDAYYPWLGFGKSRGTSDGSSTIIQNNDCVGAISFNPADGNDMTSQAAAIYCDIDGAPGADDTPGRLEFHTCPDGSSTAVERMRIRANGQVAINKSDGGSIELTRTSTSTSGLCGKIYFGNTDWDSSLVSIQSYQDGANDSGNLRFYTQPTGGAETERLRITSTGQVQIRYAGSATTGGAPLYVGVTGKSSVTYGGGQDDTACLRIEDEGSNDWYYHGLELRTKRGGDARIYAQDKGSDACDLVFATDNSAITERMRLGSDGKLGIGVYSSNPGCYKGMELGSATQNVGLSWGGASYNYTNIWAEYGSGDLWLAGGLRGNGSSSGFVSSYDGAVARAAIQIDAFGASGIHFYTSTAQTIDRDTSLTVNERMRVRENGLVAIGSPGELGNGHAGSFQVINTDSNSLTGDCLAFFENNSIDWIIKTNYQAAGTHHHIQFKEAGSTRGEIYGADGSNVAYYQGSDYRWKENIVEMSGTEGIDICKKLKPSKYNWIDNRIATGKTNTVDGFIAHEVEEAGVRGAVGGEKDAVNEDGSIKGQTLDYGQMTPVLAAAIKGLIDKVETLEAKVAALESS